MYYDAVSLINVEVCLISGSGKGVYNIEEDWKDWEGRKICIAYRGHHYVHVPEQSWPSLSSLCSDSSVLRDERTNTRICEPQPKSYQHIERLCGLLQSSVDELWNFPLHSFISLSIKGGLYIIAALHSFLYINYSKILYLLFYFPPPIPWHRKLFLINGNSLFLITATMGNMIKFNEIKVTEPLKHTSKDVLQCFGWNNLSYLESQMQDTSERQLEVSVRSSSHCPQV